MSRPGSRANTRRPFSPAWAILIAALLTATLVFWARTRTGAQLTELEALIAEHEPTDHVHAVAISSGGTAYVGTHLGLVAGQGQSHWSRVPGVTADVVAIAAGADETLYLAGEGIGISRYAQGQLQPLMAAANAAALAADPQDPNRVLAYVKGSGLIESRDRGQTWQQLSDLSGTEVYALAVHPRDAKTLVAGGVNGFLAISADGGRTWRYPRALDGSVSGLSFDPRQPQRLWAAAGGAIQYSDDLGATWRLPTVAKAKGRTVASLAFPPQGSSAAPIAVTPEGFLFSIPD